MAKALFLGNYLASLSLLQPVNCGSVDMPGCFLPVTRGFKGPSILQRVSPSKDEPIHMRYFNTQSVIIAVTSRNQER